MTNLTISLDENTVRKARLRAIDEGTSVSAKVREFLARNSTMERASSVRDQCAPPGSTQDVFPRAY